MKIDDAEKFIIPVITGAITYVIAFLQYQFIEVGKKRKIETYWKIESEYKSDIQQDARKLIEHVVKATLLVQEKTLGSCSPEEIKDQLADFYNKEYHANPEEEKEKFPRKSDIEYVF